MTTKLHRIFLLIAALGLVSCASYRGFPNRVVDVDTELESYQQYFEPKIINDYNKAVSNESERRRIRDEIINGRIAAIDIQFSLFQQKLHEEGLNLNVSTDAMIIGLGAAGALVTGGASQILSATSAAVAGMRESVDKNAFFEQTMPALFAQMIAQRKKVLAKIRTGLTNSTINYPLQQGFADLGDYQYAGSIPGSLATIVEDAGVTSAKATETLDKVLRFQMDKGAQSLEEFLGPIGSNGEFDSVKVQIIKKCWNTAGVPEKTLFIDFLLDPLFETKRVEVSDCVNKLQ